jgi:RNA 3'-terminal phosphate cyclase
MIRSSIVLAVLLDKPVKIHSIRAGRPNPGINNQLRAILVPFMDKPPPNGSQYLELIPKIPKMDKISAGTSASCTLMMQCLLPIAVFTGYEGDTVLEGGTDVSNSPPSRIIKDVFTKLIAKMGIQLNISKIKPGYYPKGGGIIQYKVQVDK